LATQKKLHSKKINNHKSLIGYMKEVSLDSMVALLSTIAV